MPISTSAKAIIAATALVMIAPVQAQAQMQDEETDVMDIARTPLEVFNIDPDDIPEVLLAAVENPYDLDGISTCNDMVIRIAELDNLLGPDFDIPQEEADRINEGRIAKSIVGSFIPFRGIVRELSGANKQKRELEIAVSAGMVRRGFLKGMGMQRGCAYPAHPRENPESAIETGIEMDRRRPDGE